MQQLALAAQLHLAQDDHANGLGATEVERTNSSKVPWLVVGPDGMELAIAHKVRVALPTSLSDRPRHIKSPSGASCLYARLCSSPYVAACMSDREHMLVTFQGFSSLTAASAFCSDLHLPLGLLHAAIQPLD